MKKRAREERALNGTTPMSKSAPVAMESVPKAIEWDDDLSDRPKGHRACTCWQPDTMSDQKTVQKFEQLGAGVY
jgi:hypothetical protein